MSAEWFYFSDDEGLFYCTRNKGKVWVLNDADEWEDVPASFEQLSRFCSDLRDVTAEEARRLPPPPPSGPARAIRLTRGA